MPHSEDQYLIGYGQRWTVAVPLGRHPVTGKQLYHRKSLRGPKMNARAYRDWYTGLIAAGDPPKETVSQADLNELRDLELRAAEFREKLLARVHAGGRVQPGPLEFS